MLFYMKNYKKYVMIVILLLTLMFPEYIFGSLAVVLIIVAILLLVADIVFDVYIIVVIFIENFRKK